MAPSSNSTCKVISSIEIRNKFVQFFEKNAHTAVPSSSLIPENDNTLMFANAGMNQFKNTFLGLEKRPYTRAVTVQKCVRAGGKHNDLENVGFTARHHTFFEMLGNFSFGDYFKKEAIRLAWKFLTEELAIPKEKLYVTVHLSDDEAADIWHQQEGVPRERIFRFDQDNFWRMGDTGPCGPCSEIFYDHGPRAGREADPFKGIAAGEDRFVEIWNLVFMQYFESAPGKMEPLPKPSVDTGSGLERVVAAMQGKLNNYDTDLFWPMIQKAAAISKKENLLQTIQQLNADGIHNKLSDEEKSQVAALRVVADHVRSSSFLIADGALPSNEGRGYVLRRILRRAIRFSQMLSGGPAFLPEVSQSLIDSMSSVYPELRERQNLILSTIKDEQDRFMSTLGTGTQILSQELGKLKSAGKKIVAGDIVFKLYDTYGFPSDLTRLMSAEQGFEIDEKSFEHEMEMAREKAKASWKGKGISSDQAHLIALTQEAQKKTKATEFSGYNHLETETQVLVLSDGQKIVESLAEGAQGLLISQKTVFYAEGGGQAGDQGLILGTNSRLKVLDCTKQNDVYIHHVLVEMGSLKNSEKIKMSVSISQRRNTAANHSATHLLHAALRKFLGSQVTQAGQMVDHLKIRFDYTYNKAITSQELEQIESYVNQAIDHSIPVETILMNHKEAVASGAMALFGEKYGDQVRVLKMGEYSSELCGGTHVTNTSQIRVFKIVSEAGVSAGVRRIEALAGQRAVQLFNTFMAESMESRKLAGLDLAWDKILLKTGGSLPEFIEGKKNEIKGLEKEIKKTQSQSINVEQLYSSAIPFNMAAKKKSGKYIFADLDVEDREILSQVADQLKSKLQTGVVVIVGKGSESHPLVVAVSKDLNPDVMAGGILKEVAGIMGGKGGGRPDFAQGAAPDRSKIAEVKNTIERILN